MKKRNILIASIYALFVITSQSCSKDDEGSTLKGEGSISISFENFIRDKKIKINDNIDYITSSEGQAIKKVTAFDYIVSNFTLVDETGKSYVYPKNKSYFIISEEGKEAEKSKRKNTEVHLDKIPAGKYTSMTFIVGVDYDKWITGSAQDELWEKATDYAMTWSWAVGYKNLRFEGSLLDKSVTAPSIFMLHVGNDGGYKVQNYRTITLKFPSDQPLLVNEDLHSSVYLHVNAGKLLDGKNKNKIPNAGKMFSIMMGTTTYADNFQEMFTIEKIEAKETAKQ